MAKELLIKDGKKISLSMYPKEGSTRITILEFKEVKEVVETDQYDKVTTLDGKDSKSGFEHLWIYFLDSKFEFTINEEDNMEIKRSGVNTYDVFTDSLIKFDSKYGWIMKTTLGVAYINTFNLPKTFIPRKKEIFLNYASQILGIEKIFGIKDSLIIDELKRYFYFFYDHHEPTFYIPVNTNLSTSIGKYDDRTLITINPVKGTKNSNSDNVFGIDIFKNEIKLFEGDKNRYTKELSFIEFKSSNRELSFKAVSSFLAYHGYGFDKIDGDILKKAFPDDGKSKELLITDLYIDNTIYVESSHSVSIYE